MSKGSKYLVAFLVCLVIFIVWQVIQINVAGGMLVNVIFCMAIFGAWKAIVSHSSTDDAESKDQETMDSSEQTEKEENEE